MNTLTAQQKLKLWIMRADPEIAVEMEATIPDHPTNGEVDLLWGIMEDAVSDLVSNLSDAGEATGLPCGRSRHYETESMARQMDDESWVGWTRYYGGGKHGEPWSVDWISGAYDVEMTEVIQPVKMFKKVGAE